MKCFWFLLSLYVYSQIRHEYNTISNLYRGNLVKIRIAWKKSLWLHVASAWLPNTCSRHANNTRRLSSTLFSEVFAFSPPLLDVRVPSVKAENDALLPPRGDRSKLPKSAAKVGVCWHGNLFHCYIFCSTLINWVTDSVSRLILEKQTGDTGGEACLIL